MITIGEKVVARGRLVERDDHEICLGFWGGGEWPWPDGVRVPREYPAVQLLASAAPDLLPLRGRNVEVRGRWDAEGRIRVDQASPAERSTPSTPLSDRAETGARPARKRSERMAAVEDPLFRSGDLLWRFLAHDGQVRGAVIRQRGSDPKPFDELLQVYAQERPGVPVTVHESRHTWQELEDAQAALVGLPDHQKASVGMGLNQDGTDVRLAVGLLYPTEEILATLNDLPEGIVHVNYLVRPVRGVPEPRSADVIGDQAGS